jgi:hypothetical protein
MPHKPRSKRRVLSRLSHNLTESVAVIPSEGVRAPADLAARFSSVLADAQGRTLSADALFDTLKLEVLDWAFDNDVETKVIDTEEVPVTAGNGSTEA